ncbi:MAG: ABC-2 family transporter protein, partial [bacterium]
MRRHLRIWWAFVKNCLAREMSFRLNFFLTLLTGSWWFLMSVLMFAVVFSHVNEIAGWTKYEVFFLLGASHVILRLFGTLFMNNLMGLPQAITTGTLDFYLIKPVHPQFIVSTRYASFEDLADTLIGLAMIVYAGWHLGFTASPADLAAFALLAVNGVVLYYSIK